MHLKKYAFPFLLLSVFISCTKMQETGILPRSNPEAEGVSSDAILAFLDAVQGSQHEFHSFMFLRHGKVIAEGWWAPYGPELKHSLYSTSKSFTSTAVGLAVSENLLSVEDKVISFFPEALPDTVSPFLAELSVKDLLTMSVGHASNPTTIISTNYDEWTRAFLAFPIENEPGTTFLYNSLATYMLSAIVQKVTGEKIIETLKPKIFDPLAIEGADWEINPEGINIGGWGLRVRTEDMAKFGQLYLQNGSWNGKQLLPAIWIEEATSFKIDQAPGLPQARRDSSDWVQGYCYQFWRCRYNTFRADGAYGQFIIVIPDQDAVIAITAETPDMQSELNLVWEYLLPALGPDPLPEDPAAAERLEQRLAGLALPLPEKTSSDEVESLISGKSFDVDPNAMHIASVDFHFMEDMCHVTLKTDTATSFIFAFGSGNWQTGVTTRPGPYLFANAKARYVGLPPLQVAGCYEWKDDQMLELILRYIESPHTETILCNFEDNRLTAEFGNSFNPMADHPNLTGRLVE